MKKTMLSICVILTLNILLAGVSLAMNTGFTTGDLPEDVERKLLNKATFSYTVSEPGRQPIDCFDVSDTEEIAVGFHSGTNSNEKTVCVYTKSGEFEYAVGFECSGRFGVEWDNENLLLYFLRSGAAVSLNRDGVPLEAVSISDTYNYSYWNNTVESTERMVNGTKYELRNKLGPFNLIASSYSQLAVSGSGSESVIYDVTSSHLAYCITVTLLIILFIGVVTVLLIRLLRIGSVASQRN